MTPYKKRLNPYIQRMAEDMQLRNLAESTIDAYTYHVDKFCQYFGKSADQLGPEEIREYQLYLVNEKKASWSSFNQAVCGLRFLYEVTLQRPGEVRHIPFGKRPKKLPVVLSDEEASRLFECLQHPKHRAVLLTCYAAGLRLREATHLRIADIDGDRKQLRINCGKGSKQRIVPASPRLLNELRAYWKQDRPSNYLFPGKTPDTPLSAALKGHVYVCPTCHSRKNVYNSCVDRHCPQCGGARRADWLAKTSELLLPKVNYFQVVFKPEPFPLRGTEFVRRWAMHILPKGYTRSRSYGGYHGPKRKDYWERCRALLGITDDDDPTNSSDPTESPEPSLPTCVRCKIPMVCIEQQSRPSWKQIFERDIYADPALYSPMHHIHLRTPTVNPIDDYG